MKENSKLEQEKQKVLQEIDNLKIDYEDRKRRLYVKEKEAIKRIDQAEEKANKLDEIAKQKANDMYMRSEDKLKQRYKKMTRKYGGFWSIIGLYSIIVTFALGYKEIAFKNDFQAFLGRLASLLLNIAKSPLTVANIVSGWTRNAIKYDTLQFVLHGMLWLIGFIVTIAFIFFAAYIIYQFYKEIRNPYDDNGINLRLYLFFNLVFLLLLIMFATSIKSIIPINIMYTYLIGNIVYITLNVIIKYNNI